jgi:hypothetical protein
MSADTALDAILRGTGLPEGLWKAGVSHGSAPPPTQQPVPSRPDARVPARRSAPVGAISHQPAGAPALPQTAQPASQQSADAPAASQGQGEAAQEPEVKATAIPVKLPARPQQAEPKPVENPDARKPRKLPAPQPAAFARDMRDAEDARFRAEFRATHKPATITGQ